jgi:hypothetical protein
MALGKIFPTHGGRSRPRSLSDKSRLPPTLTKGFARIRVAVSLSLLCCLGAILIVGWAPPARADVTAGELGTPFVYGCSTSNPPSDGDTWYNTWAGDGNIYATSDDSSGFDGACQNVPWLGNSFVGNCNEGYNSNLVVNELEGPDPEHLTSSFTNCMSSYGYAGDPGDQTLCPDHDTWKSGGLISVSGVLYLVVSRQADGANDYPAGDQATEDASIIKSTDHGRTWTSTWTRQPHSTGAAPPCDAKTGQYRSMFPGSRFANIFFINYGQDDTSSSANGNHGGNRYVYGLANNGFAYDGSNEILGRVLKTDIGSLNRKNWQYYSNRGYLGGSGNDSRNWTKNVNQASIILSAPHQLSQASIQYIPGRKLYVMTSSYYPSFNQCWPVSSSPNCKGVDEVRTTDLVFYSSPTPWGPWTAFYDASDNFGWYDPTIVSKFVGTDRLSQTIFASGDFDCFLTGSCPAANLYALHEIPYSMPTALSASTETRPTRLLHPRRVRGVTMRQKQPRTFNGVGQ